MNEKVLYISHHVNQSLCDQLSENNIHVDFGLIPEQTDPFFNEPFPTVIVLDLENVEFLDIYKEACRTADPSIIVLVLIKPGVIKELDISQERFIAEMVFAGAADVIDRNAVTEIYAKIRRWLNIRKALTHEYASGNNSSTKIIKVKDIEINLDELRVSKAGKPIHLTYTQFKLLYLLASHRMKVFSKKEILDKVWGEKVYVTDGIVSVYIKRLREKLGDYKYPSQYIETIRGTGYRFL